MSVPIGRNQVALVLSGRECEVLDRVVQQALATYVRAHNGQQPGPETLAIADVIAGIARQWQDLSRDSRVSHATRKVAAARLGGEDSTALREDYALTVTEAAELLGVSAQLVRRRCKDRRYPGAYRTDRGAWRVPRTSVFDPTNA